MNPKIQIENKIAELILLADLIYPNEMERKIYLRGVGDGLREYLSVLNANGFGLQE